MNVAAAVLGASVAAAKPKPTPLVPNNAELEARLTDNTATQRQVLREFIEQEILPLQADLEDPLLFNFAGRLDKLQANPNGVTWTEPNVNSLPNSRPKLMDFKLGTYSGFSIRNAAQIVSDYHSNPGHNWSFPSNLAQAKRQYLELVALKACYIRVQSSITASELAAVPLAEALAFYRKEGDLVVPVSISDLTNRLPPLERKFSFYLGDEELHVKPTMVHGLWSYPKAAFHSRYHTAALEASGDPFFGEYVAFIALVHWHLIVFGFDFMTSVVPLAFATAFTSYVAFTHTMWTGNGLLSTVAERQDAFDEQLGNLSVAEIDGRLIVTPANVHLMLSHILGLGLLFMKLAGRLDANGPFIDPPPTLQYLAHHTSDTRHRSDPHHDKFSWILASAAVALAKRPSAPSYCAAAYAKVRTLGLPTTLPGIPERSPVATDEHATAATVIKDNLTLAELDQLAEFVLRAGPGEWNGFKKHRANAASYARMRAYYDVATAP